MFMSFHHLMDTPHSCGATEDILEKKKHYKSWKSILIMWQLGLHPGTPHSRLLAHVGTEVPLSSKSAHRPQSLALHLCDCSSAGLDTKSTRTHESYTWQTAPGLV